MSIQMIRPGWIRFTCRVILGVLYLFIGVEHVAGNNLSVDASVGLRSPGSLSLNIIFLSALMCMVAVWLIFGIRSRVVATFGFVNLLGLNLANDMSFGMTYSNAVFAIALILSIPVVTGGGGNLAMYRAGWRNPL